MKAYFRELPVAILLSLFGFGVSWLLVSIPYVGVWLALIAQLVLGRGLGYVVLPPLLALMAALMTLGGFLFGFIQGRTAAEHEAWSPAALLVAAGIFLWGYIRGDNKSVEEDERDSSLS